MNLLYSYGIDYKPDLRDTIAWVFTLGGQTWGIAGSSSEYEGIDLYPLHLNTIVKGVEGKLF